MPTVSVRKLDSNNRPTDENDCRIEAIVGENLFEAFDNADYQLQHGCLNGACCACRVEVLKGHENLNFPRAQESESLKRFRTSYEKKYGKGSLDKREIRLTCQAFIIKKAEIIVCPI